MRAAAQNTRLKRAQALKVWFAFLELRHKAEIYQLTGHVAECPVDEANRPRGGGRAALRIPPEAAQGPAVRGVAGGAGDVPEVRAGREELRGGPADGGGGAAGERGPLPGPGRRAVGSGPVREAARASRQGRPRIGAAGADGPADQRGRANAGTRG
jgi:hypothetical protein